MAENTVTQNADQGQAVEQVAIHDQIENARMRLFHAFDHFNKESKEVLGDLKKALHADDGTKGNLMTRLEMIQADFGTSLKNNLEAIWNNWRAADSALSAIKAVARQQEVTQ